LLEIQKSFLHAFAIVLCWTILLSISVIVLTIRNPARMEQSIWRSRSYSDSMFEWITSGQLPEGSSSQVVLSHIKQTVIYCLAGLISANFLSLFMGSALLNYMNFYVAEFYGKSLSRSGAWKAWNPWSIVRVVTFLWIGVLVSVPILARILGVQIAIP